MDLINCSSAVTIATILCLSRSVKSDKMRSLAEFTSLAAEQLLLSLCLFLLTEPNTNVRSLCSTSTCRYQFRNNLPPGRIEDQTLLSRLMKIGGFSSAVTIIATISHPSKGVKFNEKISSAEFTSLGAEQLLLSLFLLSLQEPNTIAHSLCSTSTWHCHYRNSSPLAHYYTPH